MPLCIPPRLIHSVPEAYDLTKGPNFCVPTTGGGQTTGTRERAFSAAVSKLENSLPGGREWGKPKRALYGGDLEG